MKAVVLPSGLKVHLADDLGVIARIAKDPRQRRYSRIEMVALVLVIAVYDASLACQQAIPGGDTHGVGCMGVAVQAALRRQTVEIRRDDVWIAHAAQRVVALLVGKQEQDVRLLFGHDNLAR